MTDRTNWPGPADTTDPRNWIGGSYELALRFERASDELQTHIVRTAWDDEALAGCWVERDTRATEDNRIDPAIVDPTSGALYGVVSLPGTQPRVCGTRWFRDDEGGMDLSVFVPVGAIEAGYAEMVLNPVIGRAPSWVIQEFMDDLDRWFVGLARQLFRRGAFAYGAIGFMASDVLDHVDQPPAPSVDLITLARIGSELEVCDRT